MIGICLNRLLLPVLRDFTGQEISKHYTSLKSLNRIDTQVFGSHLTHDGSLKLNYSSINNNWRSFKRKERSYDYKVTTDVDLAKLYLEPHMAKFTGETICCLGGGLPYKKDRAARRQFCYQGTLFCGRSLKMFHP